MGKLYEICRCLQAFQKGFTGNNTKRTDEHQTQYMVSWARSRISQALDWLPKAYPEDAAALIEIVKEYDDEIFEEL